MYSVRYRHAKTSPCILGYRKDLARRSSQSREGKEQAKVCRSKERSVAGMLEFSAHTREIVCGSWKCYGEPIVYLSYLG